MQLDSFVMTFTYSNLDMRNLDLIFMLKQVIYSIFFLEDFNVFEYELTCRKYTWSNGRQRAFLDRFLSSLA
jgi:hypothetical protein